MLKTANYYYSKQNLYWTFVLSNRLSYLCVLCKIVILGGFFNAEQNVSNILTKNNKPDKQLKRNEKFVFVYLFIYLLRYITNVQIFVLCYLLFKKHADFFLILSQTYLKLLNRKLCLNDKSSITVLLRTFWY